MIVAGPMDATKSGKSSHTLISTGLAARPVCRPTLYLDGLSVQYDPVSWSLQLEMCHLHVQTLVTGIPSKTTEKSHAGQYIKAEAGSDNYDSATLTHY